MKPQRLVLWLLLLTTALLLLGMGLGSAGWRSDVALWADPAHHALAWHIVMDIRLPRTLGAWAAGALLALAGAVAQGLFRNPLADPYLLGSASGASLGVVLALAFWGATPLATSVWVQLGLTGAAFVGAVLAVLFTMLMAGGVQHSTRLLLSGIVVGMVLGACSQGVMAMVPEVMQAMQSFLLGNTAFLGGTALLWMLLLWLVCMLAAWCLSPVLDGLALGAATAHSLGLPVAPLRMALALVLALATGAAVAHTGLIGFVGLVAPHLVRALVRVNHARLIALASLMGGALLMAADLLARRLLAPQELPVGVVTALLGGGYLLWLMHRNTHTQGFSGAEK